MCENLISLTFKCLGILLFSSFCCFFYFVFPSFLTTLTIISSFFILVLFLPSYLLKSPLHALHLPHSVSLLTRNTEDALVIYLAWWVLRTVIFESIFQHLYLLYLPCPQLSSLQSHSIFGFHPSSILPLPVLHLFNFFCSHFLSGLLHLIVVLSFR